MSSGSSNNDPNAVAYFDPKSFMGVGMTTRLADGSTAHDRGLATPEQISDFNTHYFQEQERLASVKTKRQQDIINSVGMPGRDATILTTPNPFNTGNGFAPLDSEGSVLLKGVNTKDRTGTTI